MSRGLGDVYKRQVKYFKDGTEVTEDQQPVNKEVWVNDPSVIDVNKANIIQLISMLDIS